MSLWKWLQGESLETPVASTMGGSIRVKSWAGDNYEGGFGSSYVVDVDYEEIRARSEQVFTQNSYAKGLIRRLVTNEINAGIFPESNPMEQYLGITRDEASAWSADVESRWGLWCKSPFACDYLHEQSFLALQREARLEALIGGDVLVVLRYADSNRLPQVQLIRASNVYGPSIWDGKGAVDHGVERDERGRVVAYWVDGKTRIPAYGKDTGRRLAWLVYGTEMRTGEVRGTPLLGVVLQSIRELGQYRDASLKKAVIQSILALFIKKTEQLPGTLPITGAAVRKSTETVLDSTGEQRTVRFSDVLPGLLMEELQAGEEPVAFQSNAADGYAVFEEAVTAAIAWQCQIPPEILRLAFSSNYSASQAALNEFRAYLNVVWAGFGEAFCQPIFEEWLYSEVLLGRVQAEGLLESWFSPEQYAIRSGWTQCDWYGQIKPSTDMLKATKASENLIAGGWSTRARESRVLTGTKFDDNVKRIAVENAALKIARKALEDANG